MACCEQMAHNPFWSSLADCIRWRPLSLLRGELTGSPTSPDVHCGDAAANARDVGPNRDDKIMAPEQCARHAEEVNVPLGAFWFPLVKLGQVPTACSHSLEAASAQICSLTLRRIEAWSWWPRYVMTPCSVLGLHAQRRCGMPPCYQVSLHAAPLAGESRALHHLAGASLLPYVANTALWTTRSKHVTRAASTSRCAALAR